MNLKDGLDQLSQLFKSANDCMEKQDYRAAINYHNKVIELVQILRKPFDNGEVPLNVVVEVFPKLLQAEKAARDAISVAQLGIDAQQKSTRSTDNFDDPNLRQYTQHTASAMGYMEKGDYNSAVDEYNKALEMIQILRNSAIKQTGKAPESMILKALEEVKYSEIMIYTGLSDAYAKMGNHQKSAELEKIIRDLISIYENKNSDNAKNGGCLSTIFVMLIILSTLMFV